MLLQFQHMKQWGKKVSWKNAVQTRPQWAIKVVTQVREKTGFQASGVTSVRDFMTVRRTVILTTLAGSEVSRSIKMGKEKKAQVTCSQAKEFWFCTPCLLFQEDVRCIKLLQFQEKIIEIIFYPKICFVTVLEDWQCSCL